MEELAEAMGAALSCSRPIVDAKWLDKSRQVGTSGKTVKPKVYLALGISGSFQHLGGIKGNPFLLAVNKNPKAADLSGGDGRGGGGPDGTAAGADGEDQEEQVSACF